MNSTTIQLTAAENLFATLAQALRDYLLECEELLGLMTAENTALRATGEFQPFQFHQSRKGLLARLDRTLKAFRQFAPTWRRSDASERAGNAEMKSLLVRAQDIAVKALVLDRENQQALLRRGLLPAHGIPSAAARQPHYVANVYQRHAASAPAFVNQSSGN